MSANEASKKRDGLIHIVKRTELTTKQRWLLRSGTFLLALVAGGLFVLVLGYNPFSIYSTIVIGSFRSAMAIQATVNVIIPLLISALGVTLAFKMRFWNIGAEGQIIMGAVFATYFGVFHDGMPHWLLLPVMFIAGMIGGGLWGLLPAFFKARFNTNETLFTLMLNYIALNIVVFLRDGPWADPASSGYPKIPRFAPNAQLDKVFGIQLGWIVALVLVAVVFVYMRYTKQGYEISVVGESQATARYAGMNVRRVMLRTMFFSGAICGVAGMLQVSGSDMTLTASVAGGVGFTAIIVAWLAQLNPLGILLVSSLFGILEKGSSVVQTNFGLSADCAQVLQGIILFFVLGSEFFIRYRMVLRKKQTVTAETA